MPISQASSVAPRLAHAFGERLVMGFEEVEGRRNLTTFTITGLTIRKYPATYVPSGYELETGLESVGRGWESLSPAGL